MHVEHKLVNDVHVITPHRNLLGGAETQEFEQLCDSVLAEPNPRIVVDLEKINHVSTGGITALRRVRERVVARNARFALTGIEKRIRHILEAVQLIFHFNTFETLDQAIAFVRSAQASAPQPRPQQTPAAPAPRAQRTTGTTEAADPQPDRGDESALPGAEAAGGD